MGRPTIRDPLAGLGCVCDAGAHVRAVIRATLNTVS